jgi:type IX secretion system PorP/SprF family membrane protein
MGLGGYYLNDIAGHIKQQGLYFTYSYIASLAGDVKLSFGLTSGIQAYGVDGTKLYLNETGDQVLSNGLQTSWVPDGTFGMMFYTDRLRTGFSISQLYGSQLNFFKAGNEGTSKLSQHYNLHVSYLLGSDENALNFQPYLLMKYINPTPAQFDVGVQAIYNKNLWLGASYRTNESFSLLFGFLFRDNLTFGYSYDFITSDIGIRAKQTHEVVLGIKMKRALPKKK